MFMQESDIPEVVRPENRVEEVPETASDQAPNQAQPQAQEAPQTAPETVAKNQTSEQSQISTKESLANRIMAFDADLTGEGADIEANRQALLDMEVEDLQEMFDAEQQKVLIDQIIKGDQELNESTPEFLAQYKERLKTFNNEALQAMIGGQQERLASDGIGLDREGLQAPSPEFSTPEEYEAQLEERWMGKESSDGKGTEGGLLRNAIRANYYGEFRQQVLAEEQQSQEISQQVQKEYLEKYNKQQSESAVKQSLEEFLEENKAEIAAVTQDKIRQKIDEKIKPLIEQKFQELLAEGTSIDDFVQIVTNEKTEESFDENGEPTEEKKRKNKLLELVKELVLGLGNFTIEGINNSSFAEFWRFLVTADAASTSHRGLFEGNESLAGKETIDDEQFKKMVLENKEGTETTFQAYNKVFTRLGKEYAYLTNTSQPELLEEIEDGDYDKLKAKAKKLHELFYEQISKNNFDVISNTFNRSFNENNPLKGNFKKDSVINEKVLDLLYMFKDDIYFQNLMRET